MVKQPKKSTKPVSRRKRQFIEFMKTYWWFFALLVFPVVLTVQMIVTPIVERQKLTQELNIVHEQLELVYDALRERPLSNVSGGSLTKSCRKTYTGFISSIECGSYADFKVPYVYPKIKEVLGEAIDRAGFITVRSGTGSDTSDGVVDFATSGGIKCWGSWGKEPNMLPEYSRVSLFCRNETPDFLPGYTVE